jgi:hypothetical protein
VSSPAACGVKVFRRMIYSYSNSDIVHSITWTPETSPEAGNRARSFLQGEREILRLTESPAERIAPLTAFLETARESEVLVERSTTGDLLIVASDSGDSLLLTGKTAEVLRSYIDEEPVSTRDRLEMTIRRSIA